MLYTVYCIIFPDTKRYIGNTSTSLKSRLAKHISKAKHGSKILVHEAILKHNFNIKIETLAVCATREEANEAEKKYIAQYNTTSRLFGHNQQKGGHTLTDEIIAATGIARRGEKRSAETREKMREAQKKRLAENKISRAIGAQRKRMLNRNQAKTRTITKALAKIS